MVIRKPVYESLPYAYILIGILVVMLLESPLAYLSGILLYVAGAIVWVMRSTYRRKNSHCKVSNRRGHLFFPAWIYEYLPFIYIGLGIALVEFFDQTRLAYIPGGIMCLAGVLVWMIRAIYRSQHFCEAGM